MFSAGFLADHETTRLITPAFLVHSAGEVGGPGLAKDPGRAKNIVAVGDFGDQYPFLRTQSPGHPILAVQTQINTLVAIAGKKVSTTRPRFPHSERVYPERPKLG